VFGGACCLESVDSKTNANRSVFMKTGKISLVGFSGSLKTDQMKLRTTKFEKV
jgi:hypothetical protein